MITTKLKLISQYDKDGKSMRRSRLISQINGESENIELLKLANEVEKLVNDKFVETIRVNEEILD